MIEHDYNLSTVTAATEDPVTLAEAKVHLRVDHADEDDHITALITAATKHLETVMDRAFCSQTLRLTMGQWPACGEILLPRSPVQSVTSITYVDTGGTSQTLATSVYQLDGYAAPARIMAKYGQNLPTIRSQTYNALTVQYVAGFGAATVVPKQIKQLIMLLVAHWYENREPVNVGNIVTPLPDTLNALIWANRNF